MELEPGDHVYSRRVGYTHHGIYIGSLQVIHYSGLAEGLEAGPIEVTSVQAFGNGRKVRVINRKRGAFPRREVVDRAFSRLGEDEYNLATNNCEHFANWCVYGVSESEQVDQVAKLAYEVVKASRDPLKRPPSWPMGLPLGRKHGPSILTRSPIPTNPVEELLKNLPGQYTYSNTSSSGTVETVGKVLSVVGSLFALKSWL